tara:strand:- start:85557 stop:87644 length:2088 start_codon:yes stop_codon:yes gene_type:complete
MHSLARLILLLFAAALAAGGGHVHAQSSAFGVGAGTPHISARLEAENPRPAPGDTVTLAILMDPEPGWHGYWENPGDAGKPLELDWTLPKGASVGALRYPVPQTLVFGGLMNHVYEARYAVLVDLKLPKDMMAGAPLPIRAKADWLACTDSICVPEQAELALDLVVGNPTSAAPQNQARFDDYRRSLPRPLGGQAVFAAKQDGLVALSIPFPRAAKIEKPHFFPLNEGAKSYAAAQRIVREGDRLFVELRDFPALKPPLRGILRIGPDQGVMIDAQAGSVAMPAAASSDTEARIGWRLIALSLLGAVAGGLVLNIMPCVFPILSIKAMSLIRSHASPAHARAEAWAYAAGVMLTCIMLGGAVLGLRAAGASVGWAFQLQSPLVIVALLSLCVAIALNLAGLFTLAPVRLEGNLTTRRGLSGDFWAGVLVAFVATPCTGPFMATALGTALLLPPVAALAIFAGLGLGIALPFLLLAYVPALRARLPRPGVWMERVQRWLSVPMLLTAAALLWLLSRQAGWAGLGIGAIVAALTTAVLWWLGRRQKEPGRRAGTIAAFVCIAVAAGGITALHFMPQENRAAPPYAANAFSESALARARASGKPLFLYFTADWCLSCKVNEASAIDRQEVRAAFEKKDVQTLVGDWTNGDPAITRFLESHGRSGVPLYLWYPAGGGDPRELPQILTPTMLVDLANQTR